MSYKLRRTSFVHVVAAIIVLIALHALYDFLLESGNIGLILLALPILAVIVTGLFCYMAKARKLDQEYEANTATTSGTIPTDSQVRSS